MGGAQSNPVTPSGRTRSATSVQVENVSLTGIYKKQCPWRHEVYRRLIIERKLAPLHVGKTEFSEPEDLEECPICFLNYPLMNSTICCKKRVCTECFLFVSDPRQPSSCPFCQSTNFSVIFRLRTMRERQEEAEELRKVMEATERMRKEELQRDMERLKERRNTADNLLSSNSTPNLMGTSLGSKPIDISGFDIHMKLSADHSSALSSVGSAPTPITMPGNSNIHSNSSSGASTPIRRITDSNNTTQTTNMNSSSEQTPSMNDDADNQLLIRQAVKLSLGVGHHHRTRKNSANNTTTTTTNTTTTTTTVSTTTNSSESPSNQAQTSPTSHRSNSPNTTNNTTTTTTTSPAKRIRQPRIVPKQMTEDEELALALSLSMESFRQEQKKPSTTDKNNV